MSIEQEVVGTELIVQTINNKPPRLSRRDHLKERAQSIVRKYGGKQFEKSLRENGTRCVIANAFDSHFSVNSNSLGWYFGEKVYKRNADYSDDSTKFFHSMSENERKVLARFASAFDREEYPELDIAK